VTTFPGKGGRIDFILSSALTVTNATIMQRSTSDHNAITATFGF
jgi:endonuclease/exonuclease/phosphatase (EEP) superfamily protein YafD